MRDKVKFHPIMLLKRPHNLCVSNLTVTFDAIMDIDTLFLSVWYQCFDEANIELYLIRLNIS